MNHHADKFVDSPESETAGFAGHAVLHEGGFRDGSGLLEEIFKFDFEGLKGEIAHV